MKTEMSIKQMIKILEKELKSGQETIVLDGKATLYTLNKGKYSSGVIMTNEHQI